MQYALYLLLALIAVDAVTTYMVLDRGGSELNPVLAAILKRLGVVPGLLVTHAGLIAAVYWWQALLPLWMVLGLVAGYAYLAVRNVRAIRKLGA